MNEGSTALALTAEASIAIVNPKGEDYLVNCAGVEATLKRDVDFGVIDGTKKPSLYKSGAEKICMAYGLLKHTEIVDMTVRTDGDAPFFRYVFKCSLVKIVRGVEYVWTTGFGSANTAERRNGRNSAFNADNSTLKMAEKRALVDAALSISGLSDMFAQDMENEDFMQGAKDLIKTDDPQSPITNQQIRRLYAIGTDAGLNAAEVKDILAKQGITSTKQILQQDYNGVCDLIANAGD